MAQELAQQVAREVAQEVAQEEEESKEPLRSRPALHQPHFFRDTEASKKQKPEQEEQKTKDDMNDMLRRKLIHEEYADRQRYQNSPRQSNQ